MRYSQKKIKCISVILLVGVMLLSLVNPVNAATNALQLTNRTPKDGGSLGGTTGEISLTFNQPVEVFDSGMPQIFFMEDTNGDGVGDDVVDGGINGTFFNVMQVSDLNPNKVIFEVNNNLKSNKDYILIVSPSIRVKGSKETDPEKSDEVFAGISQPENLTGWSFNTKEQEQKKSEEKESNTSETVVNKDNEKETADEKEMTEKKNENTKKEDAEETKNAQEEIIEKIQASNAGDHINIEIKEYSVLTASILDELRKKEDITILFNGNNYSITINSSNLTDDYTSKYKFNLEIDFASQFEEKIKEIKNITEEEKYIPIYINNEGDIPGFFTILLKNQEVIEGADQLYLYYYNEEGQTLEEESSVLIEDGVISFDITHSSHYLLTDTPVAIVDALQQEITTEQKEVNSLMIVGLVIFVLVVIGLVVYYIKKKNLKLFKTNK